MNAASRMGTAALWFVLAAAGIGAAGSLAPADAAAVQSGAGEPMMLPEPKDEATAPRREGLPGDSYVAEVVDSTFFVGPAEFFALDLPTRKAGTVATHLFGTITAVGGSRDIVVRLFEGESYDRWLKRRGGDKSGPFYTSSKSRSTQIDQPLPEGKAIIVLLDNGYSIRTPKRVHCQLQIQYRRTDGRAVPQARSGQGSAKPEAKPYDDVVPTPRSNEDDDVPPPPPPPPPDGGN